MNRGLQQFNTLLSSKTFILLFIQTLEREKEFNVRDKVRVASLLSAALQNRMEYHTEYVPQLLIYNNNNNNNNPSSYTFQQLAFETLGPLNASSIAFVTELGRRLSESSRELFSVMTCQSLFKG